MQLSIANFQLPITQSDCDISNSELVMNNQMTNLQILKLVNHWKMESGNWEINI